MDGYGIEMHTNYVGTVRYRAAGVDEWDFDEAEDLAYQLLAARQPVYVTFGNGEHEFRMWRDDVTDYGNFNYPDVRWAAWYVDVEINEHRWRYRPGADLDTVGDAYRLLTPLVDAALPGVTRVWYGASDGSEEYDWQC